jgi:hypothetical protein
MRTVASITFSTSDELDTLADLCEIARRFLEVNRGKQTDFSDKGIRDLERVVRQVQAAFDEQG